MSSPGNRLPVTATWETLPQSQSWLEVAEAGGSRTGSVRSSVLNLTNTIIGAGMLGLPAAFASCGYLVGALMLAVFAGFSGMGLHLLSASADVVGRPASFRSVAESALPNSGLPYIIDAAIAIKCFGVATSYLVVVGDSMPEALVPLGASGILLDRRFWVLLAMPILVPLVAMRRVDSLKYASMLALCCLLLVIIEIVLFAVGPIFDVSPIFPAYSPDRALHPIPHRGAIAPVTDVVSVVRKLPIFVFSYTCQQNIVSITNELRRPTPLRVNASIVISETFACSMYLLVGFCGYFTFGDYILPDVLITYPATPVVAAARVLMAVSCVLSYGLQSHPSRTCILSLIAVIRPRLRRLRGGGYASVNGVLSSQGDGLGAGLLPTTQRLPPPSAAAAANAGGGAADDRWTYIVVTALFLLASTGIALVVTDLGVVLSLVGATGSTTVSYLLPGFCYLRLCPDKRSPKRLAAAVQLGVGCVIMPLSLFFIFYK